MPIQPLIERPGFKFGIQKFNWVGNIGKHQNFFTTFHKSPIKTVADAKKRVVVVAASGASGNAAVYPKIFNQVLGTKFKVVTGYKDTGVRHAITRGEADHVSGMPYQTLLASSPAWIREKK